MANLATKNFSTLVSDFAAAVQSAATTLTDFKIGSVLLAIGEANSAVALWLQGMILKLLTSTRLSTSTGSDVDSFVADFMMTRQPALQSSGITNFSRVTPSIATQVPIGAIVQSGDGSQSFAVIRDATNPNYSSATDSYPVAIGTISVGVTTQAVNGGAAGNVIAGAISVLQTGITGIDSVSNPSAFTNGADQETDAAVKTRFWNKIAALSAGTEAAIREAVSGVGQGLQVTIGENQDYAGNVNNGLVTIIVDDGTGSITPDLVTLGAQAADKVRAAGVRYGVFAAVKLVANVIMTITTAAGFSHPVVVGQVATKIAAYIQALGLGNPLPFTILESIAYSVPGVTNVSNVSLNGATLDLNPTYKQTIKPGTVAVS
jgi:uncharacterized phage protein gp47/JayE